MEVYDESTLSDYEIVRQRNIIKNYEFMKSCGLPVKPLIYVKYQPPSIEDLYGFESDQSHSEAEDEEWMPTSDHRIQSDKEAHLTTVKNPVKFFGLKRQDLGVPQVSPLQLKPIKSCMVPSFGENSSRKFRKCKQSAPSDMPSEAKTHTVALSKGAGQDFIAEDADRRARYPRRNVAKKNYKEAEVPDDDHYIYCEECDDFTMGDCPLHEAIVPLPDNASSGGLRARASLPLGLEIRTSNIPDAGLGAFASVSFPSGTVFGPYEGKKIRPTISKEEIDTSYMWEVMKDGKISHYVDGKDEQYGNWMRYINCSRTEVEQNLVAFQYHGEIYYRAYKDICPGDELMVWYGDDYAKDLGIDTTQEKSNIADPASRSFL